MCGIIGYTGKGFGKDFLINGLKRLEYRGYDSAGIAEVRGDTINTFKTEGRVETLKEKAADSRFDGEVGIGHTRWATHGAPSAENAHPHLSFDGRFAVVHNGIIENYAPLRKHLEEKGVVFKSDTDSEVIPHLLALYYDGNMADTVQQVTGMLRGAFALGVICTAEPDRLIAVGKNSPLALGVTGSGGLISSDPAVLTPYTEEIYSLEEGEFAIISPVGFEIRNQKGEITEKTPLSLPRGSEDADKGEFDHFMLKEIFQQPEAVRRTVEPRIKDRSVFFEGMRLTEERFRTFRRIVIVACGSAYHAGLVGKYVFERLLRLPTEVDVASEFRYRQPIVDQYTLCIAISQSGETADTIAAAKEAKRLGAYLITVVNVPHSTLSRLGDDVLYTNAGSEIAVATTKGYSAQLALLYLIAVWGAGILKSAEKKDLEAITEDILRLPGLIEECLKLKDDMRKTALGLKSRPAVFFIGRGIDHAVALECSLKFKEVSYIHSDAYAAGELKHGTISLIEEGTPVLALGGSGMLCDKLISNIREVASRGGKMIVCGRGGALKEVADIMIEVPAVHSLLAASLEIIPFQFLAYFTAVENGCDVDKPRNLAKSVTVE